MKKRLLLASAITAACLSGVAQAELQLNGSIEINTDTTDTAETARQYDQNGHVELGATSTKTKGDHFVMATGVIRLLTDGDTAIQDAYLKFGSSSFDAQFGRYEAINLFPLGKDTVVANAGVSVYEANMARGRVGDSGGQIGLHFNASDNLKFAVDTVYGDLDSDGSNEKTVSGIRPVVTFGADNFTVSVGAEIVKYDLESGGSVDKSGVGITSNFALGGGSANVSVARSKDDGTDLSTTSFAANYTVGNFGVGYINSNAEQAAGEDAKLNTLYAAYTMPVLDIEGASVTFAGSVSKSKNAGTDDSANALRVRFNYAF